ncbi:hypothetical protein [Actinopolymorpha sp. B9G3]|uniref:hypothetical protein n=2 Tax=Actinopolymorpha TaxID=117156 RepID=UPI0032D9960B
MIMGSSAFATPGPDPGGARYPKWACSAGLSEAAGNTRPRLQRFADEEENFEYAAAVPAISPVYGRTLPTPWGECDAVTTRMTDVVLENRSAYSAFLGG